MNENITGEKFTRIPEDIKYIKADTVDYQWDIEELYLPEAIEKVEIGALDRCSHLRKLTIPARFLSPYDAYDAWKVHGSGVNTCAAFYSFFSNSGLPSSIEEVVIYGDEVELDLSKVDWAHFKRFAKNRILRIENKVISLTLQADIYNTECSDIYINNYVENVKVSAPSAWMKNIHYNAPKPNTAVLDANAIELTLAPRKTYTGDSRWACPIIINCSAVSYIAPAEINCYETEVHQGSELLLLGEKLDEQDLENLHLGDYPTVTVWEDKDTVYKKLQAKGW